MDNSILNNISYGMYIISTKYNEKNVGCFVNSVVQITSKTPIISVSINKNNYTNEALKTSKKFGVSILSEKIEANIIGKFGFYSSKDVEKFNDIKYRKIDNVPIIEENMCGYLICEVLDIINVDTHDIFIAKVIDAKKQEEAIPMTYRYYHEVIKGKAPKSAPTYIEEIKVSNDKNKKHKCILCGYIYDDEKENVRFEDLPDDWKCPLCGANKSMFEEV